MSSQLHIASALPSVVCLAVLYFLPSAARKSLDFWRAVQVYDRNVRKQPPAQNSPRASVGSRMKKWVIILLVLSLEMIFFGTGGKDWYEISPLFAVTRQAVPFMLLTLLVTSAGVAMIHYFFLPFATVSRSFNAEKVSYELPLISKSRKDNGGKIVAPASKLKARSIVVAYFALSIGVIQALYSISNQTPKYLAILSGAMTLIATMPYQQQLLGGKRVSFRNLALYPLYILAFTAAILLLALCLVFGVKSFQQTKTASDSKVSTSSGSSSSSWGFDKMDSDLAIAQVFCILYSYLWSFMIGASSVLVCFAYRYDASQLGHGTVDEEEADEIIRQSKQTKDVANRAPIPLHTVALPRSAISKNLPVYKAAITTLVSVQIVGIAIDAVTGWQKVSFFPTVASQNIAIDNYMTVSVWPFLAYPLICIAMVVSASIRSDRTFKSLWTYGEQWMVEDKPVQSTKPLLIDEIEEAKEIEQAL